MKHFVGHIYRTYQCSTPTYILYENKQNKIQCRSTAIKREKKRSGFDMEPFIHLFLPYSPLLQTLTKYIGYSSLKLTGPTTQLRGTETMEVENRDFLSHKYLSGAGVFTIIGFPKRHFCC